MFLKIRAFIRHLYEEDHPVVQLDDEITREMQKMTREVCLRRLEVMKKTYLAVLREREIKAECRIA